MVHDSLLNSLRILTNLELLPPSERHLAAETVAKMDRWSRPLKESTRSS